MAIVSDGPYGIDESRGGYSGDRNRIGRLVDFYKPHVEAWAAASTSLTTLWFWCSEEGWAEVHSLLVAHGFSLRGVNTWDKGVGHIAGNCNTQTMRKFPTVTEVCAHYDRPATFITNGERVSAQDWMRSEWRRTGLPFHESNRACGVKNAASRKYLASDHLWYFPPQPMFDALKEYANRRGASSGFPYFEFPDSVAPTKWECMRAKFKLKHGVTNVWRCNKPSGKLRTHRNQKPQPLIDMILEASTDEGDAVWEPFGGSFPAMRFCDAHGRVGFGSEILDTAWRV